MNGTIVPTRPFHRYNNKTSGDTVDVAIRSWLNGFVQTPVYRQIVVRLMAGALVLVPLLLSACSTGQTRINETHFLAVPSGGHVNFYRVHVEGHTAFGVTDFHTGWYPADAVDSLYGDASDKGAVEAFRVKEQIRSKYDAAILKTQDGYLNAASDPKTDAGTLQSWLLAQRRVRATAGADTPLPQGAIELEYNPVGHLATPHAGQKLVLVLSSDPTSVIAAISSFSSEVQTGATVMDLADLVRQQTTNDLISAEARNDARAKTNPLIAQRLAALSDFLKTKPTRTDLLREIDSMRVLLENYK
jgi:hypothetical protein